MEKIDKHKSEKERKKQGVYNRVGILLVIGIVGGTGLLLAKYSDEKKEPIKITEPKKEELNEAQARVSNLKLNINTATAAEFDKLDGIGPSIAQKIIDYRSQNGLFKNIEDLKNVPGIGEGKFETIKEEVSL